MKMQNAWIAEIRPAPPFVIVPRKTRVATARMNSSVPGMHKIALDPKLRRHSVIVRVGRNNMVWRTLKSGQVAILHYREQGLVKLQRVIIVIKRSSTGQKSTQRNLAAESIGRYRCEH